MYCVMSLFETCDQNLYCHTLQQINLESVKPELVNQVGIAAKSRIVMSPLAA